MANNVVMNLKGVIFDMDPNFLWTVRKERTTVEISYWISTAIDSGRIHEDVLILSPPVILPTHKVMTSHQF